MNDPDLAIRDRAPAANRGARAAPGAARDPGRAGLRRVFRAYLASAALEPLFAAADARQALSELPDGSIDCAMTSPPYWGKREYSGGGIGLETGYDEYVRNLLAVFRELRRALKPGGSFWLNMGDTYRDKGLLGIPWRVVLAMTDKQGWILRNTVVWNKVKGGMDNSADRLANVHENVYHLTKRKHYHYDLDAIRSKPGESKVVNGAVVSATGVSGVRYRRQIELSTALTAAEKEQALRVLDAKLAEVASGRLADFRMIIPAAVDIDSSQPRKNGLDRHGKADAEGSTSTAVGIIRGRQRATHSDSEKVSGRAKELRDKGFYFLRFHPNGSKPGDVWDIVPEDTQNRRGHFAPYPVDLCRIPILATCPPGGVVMDPFCGTGTTLYAAKIAGRKSIGIDISEEYIELARERCESLL